jgi:isopentenyl-diphosphate delta-isomerase
MTPEVILVDEHDNPVGIGEKMTTHRTGDLHRAFSIFIFNPQGQMLIHRRAGGKYHSAGLWTNACCSHPRPGESTEAAAHRRLQEEMGFDTQLEEVFQFTYRAEFENDLIEHELDHVFVGTYDGDPSPDPDEVGDWTWVDLETLEQDLEERPNRYTPWFRQAVGRVIDLQKKSPLPES